MKSFVDAWGKWAATPEGKAQIQDATTQIGNALVDGLKFFIETSQKIYEFLKTLFDQFNAWTNTPEGKAAIDNLVQGIGDGLRASFDKKVKEIDWGAMLTEAITISFKLNPVVSSASFLAGLIPGFQGLPGFQSGGIVPGAIGAPQLAVVHGGETIIPRGGRGGGMATINVNIDYHPMLSMADHHELRQRLQPVIEDTLHHARSRQIGATA